MKIVGIAGGSGSGKSTVCRRLIESLGIESVVIPHDNYYRCLRSHSQDQRESVNFDHPDSLESELLCRHLDVLRGGEPIEIPTYCFATHTRETRTIRIAPKPLVFVDGVLALSVSTLRSKFDISIFVHADDEIRFQRRQRRDTVERGRTAESVRVQWATSVFPMHKRFVDANRHHADLEIDNGPSSPSLDDAIKRIRGLAEES